MRTDRYFLDAYRKALRSTDPAAATLSASEDRALGLTELCLEFLASHVPGEDISALPYLLLGYPKLVAPEAGGEFQRALVALRHLCSRYMSVSAWLDACRQHALVPATLRCFSIVDRKPVLRVGAPDSIVSVLRAQLGQRTPWHSRPLQRASAGDALVRTNRGETLLAYQIPPVETEEAAARRHALTTRPRHAPIQITLRELEAVAEIVDAREAMPDWPATLPPLRLGDRLAKLRLEGFGEGFFDGETLTLDGAVHVLGMLSAGKSTLVWLIILALTLGGKGKRIGVLVSDTIQGATLTARLRRHGVGATVLSSFHNRDRHLNSIHWQQGLSPLGWSMVATGDVATNFSTACPLDGLQREPAVVRGGGNRPAFPLFKEKPCHRLYQRREDAERDDGEEEERDADSEQTARRSCPLWAQCPAQEQQRLAVTAQVIALTPQAFVHMTPDKWTSNEHLTLPELFQHSMDLVIIDEVDSVQKTLDDIFAPRSPIMGDERDVYAPSISAKSSEALRERSGVQFRLQVNARWQANFHVFYRLIGTLYALLQNERADLADFYRNTPFTAGGILYEIWRRRQEVQGLNAPGRSFDDPELEEDFLEVIKVAGAISRFSTGSAIARDQEADIGAPPGFRDRGFGEASEALQAIARETLISDYYEELAERVEAALDGPLAAFNAVGPADAAGGITPRGNALALLLAVVTDLVLSHYHWLVKAQPAVATDLGIDDAQLFSQANNLLRHYRTLLPSNPAGAVFGLLYDDPDEDRRDRMGGKLTLINHLGVGRHLITHLHDLLGGEGQAGPHVLMLSGTSWAGGAERQRNSRTGKPMDCASPSFDVQVRASGVLLQPQAELDAINRSMFELVSMREDSGRQVRVSGLNEVDRRRSLAGIANRLAARRDDGNLLQERWLHCARDWGPDQIAGRRRALLVTNSYADAAIVADSMLEALEVQGFADWRVFGLTRDRADDGAGPDEQRLRRARALPRSLIERFGEEAEQSILVAPMQVIARGHNILNADNRAAIASIYFLHRPHPRPDDLSAVIARLNRYAVERFDRGMRDDPEVEERLSQRARRMRYAATNIVRYSLYSRSGYSGLSAEYKAQFAWDMLTPLWQTIGRGIRNGCPIHVGFVDRQFAPLSFDGGQDSPDSSVLLQALAQLDVAMAARNAETARIGELLYRPFRDALSKTKGLAYA